MLTTQAIDHLLSAAARGALTRAEGTRERVSVRTQAAVVRSLVHELELRSTWDGIHACLVEQLKEELTRLMHLIRAPEGEDPSRRPAPC